MSQYDGDVVPFCLVRKCGIMEIETLIENFDKTNTVQDILTGCVDIATPNWNVAELTEKLILCSASTVNLHLIESLNITCIISCAPELPDNPFVTPDIIYKKINVVDGGEARISKYFDDCADLIHEIANRSEGRVLVYCVAGVSRSPTICLAYLMKYHRLTLSEAYNYVKIKRSKIKPNCGFFKQLIEYEKTLFGSATVQMVYNEYVRMEIPDVYECEYKFSSQFNKKTRNVNGRY